ncbi:MAG: hypothetical protein NC925_04105 [Candidatus Omnitrophica bacterium]|nr:hypothetical protein [Candidatus Omnitrophota bacterium]MCM8830771.1 hypothetical protein [Candidatus Omnitrophota bacterium]
MNYEIKELIERIQKEGIEEAEKKASLILEKAKTEAENIIKDANLKAEEILFNAEKQAQQLEEKTKNYLEQIIRDTLISLKNEINKLLIEIIQKKTEEVLSSNEFLNILEKIILQFSEKEILIYLPQKDFVRLKDTFIKELQERFKKEILFVPTKEIDAGLQISFDKGKSYFEVSDKSLSEYLFEKLSLDIKEIFK